jgi:hypothetical protein
MQEPMPQEPEQTTAPEQEDPPARWEGPGEQVDEPGPVPREEFDPDLARGAPWEGSRVVGGGGESLWEELDPALAAASAATTADRQAAQGGLTEDELSPSVVRRRDASYEAIRAAERLNREAPAVHKAIRQLDSSELQEVLEHRSGYTVKLRSARDRALRALEDDDWDADEADWRTELLPAAEQILSGLDGFLGDEQVWARLQGLEAATGSLSAHARLVLREVCDQNLKGLLKGLGYHPALARQLEAGLKESLAELLEGPQGEAMRAMKTRAAQQNMAVFTHRLRGAVDAAKRERDGLGGSRSSPSQPERVRTRLRAVVQTGAEVVAPAVLAAGAVGLAFPSGGRSAQVLGIAAGVVASGKELLKQVVQLSAMGFLGKLVAREASTATTAERFQGATVRADNALSDYVASLAGLAEDPTDPMKKDLAERLGIESLSSVYGLLQAELDHDPTAHRAISAVTDEVLASLREAQDRVGALEGQPGALSVVARALEVERGRLRNVLPVVWKLDAVPT